MSPSLAAAYLLQRARVPDALELADIPWLHALEGTVIKREAYRYNIEALPQRSVQPVHRAPAQRAPRPVQRCARDRPPERLGRARRQEPGGRFHQVLYPGVGTLLRITQQELGYLVGLSRQRVNEALGAQQSRGLIRVEYGGVKVTDLERLRGVR